MSRHYEIIDGLVTRSTDIAAEVAALIQHGDFAAALTLQKAAAKADHEETVAAAKRNVDELLAPE